MPPRSVTSASAWRRSCSASGPLSASSASAPPKNTKPTVTTRCSATRPAAVCSTSQPGTNGSTAPTSARPGVRQCCCGRVVVEHAPLGRGLTEHGRIEERCCVVAEQDLTALGRPLTVHRGAHAGPDHEEFPMPRVDEVEVEGAAVDALRDPELHALHQRRRPGAFDQATHPEAGRSSAGGVLVTGEQHEQGVTAELENVAAEVVDDLDHPAEALVQQDGEFLGTLASVPGEPLRQCGEAGDVGRHQRPENLPVWRVLGRPVPNEVRDVRRRQRFCRRG